MDCPGCGFQRSVLLLMKGEFAQSINMYWGTIPILAMLTYLLLYVKFRFRGGSKLLVWMYCGNAILILCHYFYKLSHY
jgi:hypothetical protein